MKKKRDFRFFEAYARHNKMKPVCRVIEKSADILIADSGKRIIEAGPEGSIAVFYRTAYAIDRGDKTWIASMNETSALAPEMVSRTERGRQEYRVDECLTFARKHLADMTKAELFSDDGGQKRIARPPA